MRQRRRLARRLPKQPHPLAVKAPFGPGARCVPINPSAQGHPHAPFHPAPPRSSPPLVPSGAAWTRSRHARAWADLARAAKKVLIPGLASALTSPAPTSSHRLLGPLAVQSGLDPHQWACLCLLDLSALERALVPALADLPATGWLHLALHAQHPTAGDIDIQWLDDPAPLHHPHSGFGWANPTDATTGLPLSWKDVRVPKPPSWFGFSQARTAIWTLALDSDDAQAEEDMDRFLTEIEDTNAPVFDATLGLDPHWTQDDPFPNTSLSPLLALHSSSRLSIQDGGTLGVFLDPKRTSWDAHTTRWSCDSF